MIDAATTIQTTAAWNGFIQGLIDSKDSWIKLQQLMLQIGSDKELLPEDLQCKIALAFDALYEWETQVMKMTKTRYTWGDLNDLLMKAPVEQKKQKEKESKDAK